MDPRKPSGWRRPTRPDESAPPGRAVPGRDRGIQQARRMSNWTAAALIAATAATTGYFAHASRSTAAPSAAAGAGSASSTAPGTHRPCITVPVATSGGSGVTARAPAAACGSGTSGSGSVNLSANPPAAREDS
jgi:hypothetical protein